MTVLCTANPIRAGLDSKEDTDDKDEAEKEDSNTELGAGGGVGRASGKEVTAEFGNGASGTKVIFRTGFQNTWSGAIVTRAAVKGLSCICRAEEAWGAGFNGIWL